MSSFFLLPLLLLGLVAGALAIIYGRANRETMTAAAFRENSGYDTAALTDGITAFRDLGPHDAPVLVLIHGATLGSVAYEEYYEPFIQGGYRVIAYDQYGRGFSDRTNSPLNIDCMRRQLIELLDHLQVERAVLYGISLGGALAARFGAEHPERVRAIGLQVPLIRGATSPLVYLGRIPLINRFLMRVVLTPKAIQRGEAVDGEDAHGQRVLAHFRSQFSVIGTEKCLLSMLTGDALGDRLPDHTRIASAGTPIQFAYATDDPEIAPALVEQAIAMHDQPDVAPYTGGHFFSNGRQEELAVKLLEFLQQNESA